MAKLNVRGHIVAKCPDCDGRESNFEYRETNTNFGSYDEPFQKKSGSSVQTWYRQYRLFRCASCGRGGLAKLESPKRHNEYPQQSIILKWFYLESGERIKLPDSTPQNIKAEFEEAEKCIEAKCYRAAAAMFRSTLEKVFEANGYKTKDLKNLYKRIEKAAEEGIITDARRISAHDEVRVLGNDVLHEPYEEFNEDAVQLSHKYTQRIIEDIYDQRESVEKLLKEKQRSFTTAIEKPEENDSTESEEMN